MVKETLQKYNKYARRTDLYLSCGFTWAIVIFVLSVIPGVDSGINSGPAAHSMAYATLSFLWALYFRGKGYALPSVKGALLAAAYGSFIEAVQYVVPYRSCEAADAAVNFGCALAGALPVAVLIQKEWL